MSGGREAEAIRKVLPLSPGRAQVDIAGTACQIDPPRSSSVGLNIGAPASSKPVAMRILVAEGDPVVRQRIVNYLDAHDVRAVSVSGRQAVDVHCADSEPDLLILDQHRDRGEGLDLLRDIRGRSDVPVIITSREGSEEIDRVLALELGADDYVVDPFSLRELLARIRTVLRRRGAARAPPPESMRNRCRFGDWELDRLARRLTDPSGVPIALTKGQYALLTAFLDAPQRPLSREHLLQATRVHQDVFDRSTDVQVLRLRRKLEADPSAPRIIRTDRGVGYVFSLAVEPA